MENKQNSDEAFEGLGVIGWIKLVLRTRAQTIKQCDQTIDRLFTKLNESVGEANHLRSVTARLGALVVQQHEALEAVLPVIIITDVNAREAVPAYGKVEDAIKAAKAAI